MPQVVSLLSLTLLEVHLVRRMLETAYVMHYPEGARMHLIAYAFGLRYAAVNGMVCMTNQVDTPQADYSWSACSYYIVLPLSCTPAALLTKQNVYTGKTYEPDWKSVARLSHVLMVSD